MNKFILLSAALLWFTYTWSPVAAQTNRCAKYTTNATCLTDGGCGCGFLLCDTVKSCVPVNETTGMPFKMPDCNRFQRWWNCTRSSSNPSGGETSDSSIVKPVLITLAIVIAVGAAVGVFVWVRARRRSYSTVA